MSQRERVEEVLNKAGVSEEKHDWVKAKVFYEQVLRVVRKGDSWRRGEIRERIGYTLYRAAFQAKNRREFKRLMRLSSEAYEEAARLFDESKDSERHGKTKFCRARALYDRSWVADGSKRKLLLNECWRLLKVALKASKKSGDLSGSGKLCNELLYCLYERSLIEWKRRQLNKIVAEAVGYGETAIDALSKVKDEKELATAYSLTSLHCFYAANISELEEKKREFSQKCLGYAQKALELSKQVGDRYLIGLSNWAVATAAFNFSDNITSSLEHAEKMLQQGKAIQDNYLIGVAYYQLAFINIWKMRVEEDPNNKREEGEKAIQYAENAIRHLHIVNNNYFVAETPIAESYSELACEVETDRERKRSLLEKAVKAGRKKLQHAELSASPDALGSSLHELSKALYFLSNMRTKISEKKKLLQEASKHRQDFIRIVERMYPSNYWVRGYGQNYQALIKAELAKIEPDRKRKREFLEEAASNMDNCLKLIEKWAKLYPQTRIFAMLGKYYDRFGGIMNQLYSLSEDEKVLEEAVEAYGRVVNTYCKAELPSRVAEAHWNIARLYDRLGGHVKASENFKAAADVYEASAEKIPHLEEFYADHKLYMLAWSEIEKARHNHAIRKYGQAKEHYEKAADLHKSTVRWNYLSSDYLAWAKLEEAEDLSRREQTKEARDLFQEAADLFVEAKQSINAKLEEIDAGHEKELATELAEASDTRREYCLGRAVLEEAKTLDRQGDHAISSRKYGNAVEKFQKVVAAMEHESDRQELKPIIDLTRAWQLMTRAEAEVAPVLYLEASRLFDEAKEHSIDEKAKELALGHSSFCRALEAGTRFEATRDMALYSTTKKHLEAAESYYLKADFKNASEYAKATHKLFDAYMYAHQGETETEPRNKSRYYRMAEKLLQASAGSYMKAKHPEKSEEVQRLLDSIKEKRRLAMSLTEVLHAPAITSTTTSFSTPNPTHEEAFGLERFEQAYVQANLSIRPKEVNVGEDLGLELRLVNTGKEPASLVKVEEILPSGFEPVEKPDYCHFEDAYVDMKGKKLDPLKTEEVRLVLRPFDKGSFAIKPRIVYVDETGHQMSSEPEPITINVSEVILPGRITTGYRDLDSLMFGGIPENYAVILTSPSCDERDLLIRRFLEAGATGGEVTFYVTIDPGQVKLLAEEFQSNFSLIICNPKADKMIESLPNVFKLKGVEDPTNISIALIKAFRRLDTSVSGPRRVCIEIISDVLLQHHSVQTRKWLTGLIPDLRSRGFTTLAVMNPRMHPSEDVHAILGLFEGEISIHEKETKEGLERSLRVKKMYNQRYLDSELPLRKEKLGR